MAKQLKFNEEAREALKKGIDQLAQAVRMTLGPRGRAAVIEASYGAPDVTFDGVTVAKEIELEDKYENLGAEFIKQAAEKTNDNVGDGTTTSVVLAQAMIDEGEKLIRDQGFNVIQLARELVEASREIVVSLEGQKEVIGEDQKKIEEVATLSSKSRELGKLIAEVMVKVGKEGVVTVEDSNTIDTSFDLVEGMQFDRGYISSYMVTDSAKMEAVLEDPMILITDKKISAIQDVLGLLESMAKTGKKDLLIIADDVEGEALATFIINKLRGVMNIVAVKAPGFGDRKKEMLSDIAVLVKAHVVSADAGLDLQQANLEHLGSARRVIVTKDDTTVVEGRGEGKSIEERVAQLKRQLEDATSDFDKEKLHERIARMSGGVAVLKIGAATESAQKELKQRVDDAVHATRAAMEEGIVPGGGIALFNVSLERSEPKDQNGVSVAVYAILERSLRAPVTAIIENSGMSASDIIGQLASRKKDGKDQWLGFNASTNEISDLKEAGIIDPLKVTKSAFLNAISVASNYLTVGVAITNIPEEKDKGGGMPSQMGGMM
ncbi:MAG: chaperonin GroEL [bacterium]|nr:chaperonin GroEL [bacterium]